MNLNSNNNNNNNNNSNFYPNHVIVETGNLILIYLFLSKFVIGKRGRREKPFEELSELTQFDKLDLLVCDCMMTE